MGINLGAFLAPLACGWLAENTVGGYHSGFIAAGIGMVLGLVIYLVGQPLVREIDPATPPVKPVNTAAPVSTALTEAEAARTPSVLGALAGIVPAVLRVLGGLMLLAGVMFVGLDVANRQGAAVPAPVAWSNAVMVGIGGGCLLLMAYVCTRITGGVRDRVLAILALGVFVIFFWAAFEQAGNVLNLWADKNTNRYLTQQAQAPDVVPKVVEDAPKAEGAQETTRAGILERYLTMFRLKPKTEETERQDGWLTRSLNPVPTAWFQSINALAIFLFAPFVAWMWVTLDRRGWQPSIPMKMALGLLLMSASMGIMVASAMQENKPTSARLQADRLPDALTLTDAGQIAAKKKDGSPEPFHAGRLTYEAASHTLHLQGVLPDTEANNLIEETAPASFREQVVKLKKESEKIDGEAVKSVSVQLAEVPPGFDMQFAGLKKSVLRYDPADRTLTAFQPLADKEVKALLVAAGAPGFRATVQELYIESSKFRVSSWWLFWSYILATLGELCLSPVGLSMVSKLAPARFATMLMGVWMLTASFGNFAAGALGEVWGTIPPVQFFAVATAVVGGAALVLFVLVRKIVATMHGVN
jgi:dipeptide/tripeptide permease